MTATGELVIAARAWMAEDPDPSTRVELEALLRDVLDGGNPEAEAELEDRFADRLRFGTAGLRGAVSAGPNRMNRAVVRLATAGLAAWLADNSPESAEAGVVIGCDARHGSDSFADEVALVLTGAGIRVLLLERQRPTPLLAFAVPHLGAAAGVMITASHNPPQDNGYKLYLSDGAQIVPPVDAEIETLMGAVGPLSEVPIGQLSGPLVTCLGAEILEAFLDALAHESPAPPGGADLRIVYTPLHGVALGSFEAALERAGYGIPVVVAAQALPDPDFPTVAFPNPEEPGALDLALEAARHTGADVVIANDPDGDRLAVAVPDADAEAGWRTLRGDEVGSLLGNYLLERSAGQPEAAWQLVVTTIVSSSMLSRIAAAAGVRYAETLTGFKWIVRAAEQLPGTRFVFGYEEALGYSVGTVVRDKDGLGAALCFLGMVTEARAKGLGVTDLLDSLACRHGVHLTAQLSIRSEAPEATMRQLRTSPPSALAGRPVTERIDLLSACGGAGATDLPPADVLVYRLEGARLVVRPSGTEPKLKVYFEVVRQLDDGGSPAALARAREAAAGELAVLQEAVFELLHP